MSVYKIYKNLRYNKNSFEVLVAIRKIKFLRDLKALFKCFSSSYVFLFQGNCANKYEKSLKKKSFYT